MICEVHMKYTYIGDETIVDSNSAPPAFRLHFFVFPASWVKFIHETLGEKSHDFKATPTPVLIYSGSAWDINPCAEL